MADEISLGRWLQRRRKAFGLTQAEVAQRVGCAAETLRKIEADARRPSRQIAERLAQALELPEADRLAFVRVARAELSVDRLASPIEGLPQLPFVAPAGLSTGTLTFLFTDIAGSTLLWDDIPQQMQAALSRHDAILHSTTKAYAGVVVKSTGDGMLAVFPIATDALAAAIAAQQAMQLEDWSAFGTLRIRMALHTGVAESRAGDYFGLPVNRAARLLAAGHGGQILLSLATAELVRDHLPADVTLQDLGIHRLKDLARPEHIFQVIVPNLPADFPALRTLDARHHNLSSPPNTLIGRELELAQIYSLLCRADTRLVTLTGPGGTGKTHLALQAAAELLDAFPDGVWFVDLAPINNSDLVIPTILQLLRLKEQSGQSAIANMQVYLYDKQLLLVLDNFEQVVDAAKDVANLLAAAPGLKVLITSRVVLKVRSEQEVVVPPLALPDLHQLPPPDLLPQYAAVALFIKRARAVKADFAVTNANAPAVAEICARLDGLPLAIELAAARIKLFPPEALLARLSSRLSFLTGVMRDLPARQQTIRNTIAWSYYLLDQDEKTLFTRLGVFVGGCTLEAAEAVCNADSDLPIEVLEGTAALLDKSLLRQDEGSGDEPRITMLETIREYALEQLAERGEADAIRQQHARYFLKFAEKYDPWPRIHAPPHEHSLARLDAEHDNLRAAAAWFAEQGEAEQGVQLAGALVGFWADRFYWSEGRAWLEAALARRGNLSIVARAKAVFGTAWLALRLNDSITARAYVEQALALFRELSDKAASALAVVLLGSMVLAKGESALAQACAEESLALFQALSDQWGCALAVRLQGSIALAQGDVAQAAIYYEQILNSFRQISDKRGIGESLIDTGYVAQIQGEWEQALACYAESLQIFRELGAKEMITLALHNLGGAVLHQGDARRAAVYFAEGLALSRAISSRYGIAMNLAGMAGVMATQKQPERSARLFGAADALFDAIDQVVDPADRTEYDHNAAIARARLGDQAFTALWKAGQAMPIEQAIADALDEGSVMKELARDR